MKSKLSRTVAVSIVFTYILLIPFGQLLRFEANYMGKAITILGVDLVASLSLIYFIFIKKPEIAKYFNVFFASCLFSLILNIDLFGLERSIISSLYLIRLFIYYSFFVLIWDLSENISRFKKDLIGLMMFSLILAVFLGWIQYIYFFDLTYLKYSGWDDHLGRFVGTFLDPAFTGMFIVLGFFIVFLKYLTQKKLIDLILSIFFLISLLLTYSRASYLSLFVGLILIYFLKKRIKPVIFAVLLVFILLIPFLPRGEGEGVRLERTKSITLRLENYQETFQIIEKSPLFGIGFNNICWARAMNSETDLSSHSCSGSDSSLLLIIATSGVVGLLLFSNLIIKIIGHFSNDYYGDLSKVFFTSLFFHSFFSNSLFYPMLMGVGFCLLAISIKENK